MVKLNSITTKTGDDGTTGLVGGERRLKSDLRIEAIGEVDEANSAVGFARALTHQQFSLEFTRIQNDLFDLGAGLADASASPKSLRISAAQVEWLEQCIEKFTTQLMPLSSFVLPGGSPLAAQIHLTRSIVRRAERRVVALSQVEAVGRYDVIYLNRLSDYLFQLARVVNDNGAADILWRPGAFQ